MKRVIGTIFLLSAAAHEVEAGQRFECPSDVVACVKKAHKACPRNVTFIADRNATIGFRVFIKGTPVNEQTVKKLPMYVICTPS